MSSSAVEGIRRSLGVVAAVAVALVAVLPPEHVHLGVDGHHSIVHRHRLLTDSPSNPTLRSHAATDHSHAIFLDPAFEVHRAMPMHPVLAPIGVVPPVLRRLIASVGPESGVRINGPPRHATVPRAPPLG
jgi:hypothetical protein